MRLYIYYANQCDPKKCTGKKLARFELATLVRDVRRLPRGALLLNPFVDEIVSRADAGAGRLCVLDCSWEHAREVFTSCRYRLRSRRLPFLLAANPVSFGKAHRLTTAEAFAASLFIMGYTEHAHRVLEKFNWGHTFFELNEHPLDDYASAATPEGVREAEGWYV